MTEPVGLATRSPAPRRVAIVGATGYIGGRLVPRLLEAGYPVRCLVRSPRKLMDRTWADQVEIHQVGLVNVGAIARSLADCHAAYYLVHTMVSGGPEDAAQDLRMAANFAEAARQAGVGRIIYLGGLGETGPKLSAHLAARREVEGALASTGIPITVLRAAMIIGSGSASFEILRYLVERLPLMMAPKWVSAPCQPIAVRNVIGYLVGALAEPRTAGAVFDIGGSDVMCYRDIMRVMAEELGLKHRWVIPVPFLTVRLSSCWIHLLTPLGYRIAKPLAEGLKNPVVCRESRIRTLIPQECLGVREAIRAAYGKTTARSVETDWSMAGPMPGDPDWAGGTVFRDERQVVIPAPTWAVFQAVCRIGGEPGWFGADWLWRIRGLMDRLVGGPGLRRGRRDPERIAYGEAVGFWRVVGVEPNRLLALRAEMKLPGEALLEFRIEPRCAAECALRQAALFKPRGLFGLGYWYAVVPFHHVVFRAMLEGIKAEARRIASRR